MTANKNPRIGMIAAMPFPPTKASSIRVVNELNFISKHYQCSLYCVKARDDKFFMPNVEVTYSRFSLNLSDYYKYYKKIAKAKIIFDLSRKLSVDIKKKKVDLIHAHTLEGVLIGRLAMLMSFKRLPMVADIHGPFVREIFHYRILPKNRITELFLKVFEGVALRNCSKILITSHGLLEIYSGSEALKNKLVVFNDYVDLDKFNSSSRGGEVSGTEYKILKEDCRIKIMYAGTLKSYQGLDDLLKAFKIAKKQQKNLSLYILGAGGLGVDYFVNMASKIGLKLDEDVRFIGQVNHNEVPNYLNKADILVSSRKKTDVTLAGFVSQLPEYLAMGKIVVATRISGCEDMLMNGEAGFLCNPDDPVSLADAIVSAVNARNQWSQYQELAIQSAHRYSWQRNTLALTDMYTNLLKVGS